MPPSHSEPASESQETTAPVPDSAPTDLTPLENELAAQKDRYLRLCSDFDNFRKRTRHEAVYLRHDLSKPDHTVLGVLQRGYCRGEHVFRPAKVIVNAWSPSADAG